MPLVPKLQNLVKDAEKKSDLQNTFDAHRHLFTWLRFLRSDERCGCLLAEYSQSLCSVCGLSTPPKFMASQIVQDLLAASSEEIEKTLESSIQMHIKDCHSTIKRVFGDSCDEAQTRLRGLMERSLDHEKASHLTTKSREPEAKLASHVKYLKSVLGLQPRLFQSMRVAHECQCQSDICFATELIVGMFPLLREFPLEVPKEPQPEKDIVMMLNSGNEEEKTKRRQAIMSSLQANLNEVRQMMEKRGALERLCSTAEQDGLALPGATGSLFWLGGKEVVSCVNLVKSHVTEYAEKSLAYARKAYQIPAHMMFDAAADIDGVMQQEMNQTWDEVGLVNAQVFASCLCAHPAHD